MSKKVKIAFVALFALALLLGAGVALAHDNLGISNLVVVPTTAAPGQTLNVSFNYQTRHYHNLTQWQGYDRKPWAYDGWRVLLDPDAWEAIAGTTGTALASGRGPEVHPADGSAKTYSVNTAVALPANLAEGLHTLGVATDTNAEFPFQAFVGGPPNAWGCGNRCHQGAAQRADITIRVVRDTTPPVIVPGLSGTMGNNGWYTSNVGLSWTITDPESPISFVSGNETTTVNYDTAGAIFTATATSAGGTSSRSVTVKRDATAPVINVSRTPGPNANGWNNTDVTVNFTAVDGLSGLASAPGPTIVTGEGADLSVSGTATDQAGNTAYAVVTGINIDKTAPTLVFGAPAPAPNPAGWVNASVSINYNVNDNLSGVAWSGPASPLSFVTEGAGQTQGVTVVDRAGNSATFTSPPVSIDKTSPAVVFGAASPPANAEGWNNTDVSVPFTAGDGLSGVAGTSPLASPVALTSEGSAVKGLVTAADRAGNSASFDTPVFRIDKTPPTISGSRSPAANSYGWNNTDVTVSFLVTDDLSGVAAPPGPITLTGEGPNQSATGTATDRAGNSASATVGGINMDKTKPTLSFGPVVPAPNLAGWNNSDVSIAYTPDDKLSGVASAVPSGPLSFSGEGSGLTRVVTVTDRAGNAAAFVSPAVNLDQTGPEITVISPVGRDYLTSEILVLSFAATDTLSGVASLVATLDGAPVRSGQAMNLATMAGNHTLRIVATDMAGNKSRAVVSFSVVIAATLDIDPNTLNLKSQADRNALTAYVEFPPGYDVAAIDVATVRLKAGQTLILAQATPTSVGDHDRDGIPDRMFKFDRQAVIGALNNGAGNITLMASGRLTSDQRFTGSDAISVINPPK